MKMNDSSGVDTVNVNVSLPRGIVEKVLKPIEINSGIKRTDLVRFALYNQLSQFGMLSYVVSGGDLREVDPDKLLEDLREVQDLDLGDLNLRAEKAKNDKNQLDLEDI